jgi:hypothetical protein
VATKPLPLLVNLVGRPGLDPGTLGLKGTGHVLCGVASIKKHGHVNLRWDASCANEFYQCIREDHSV